jgi:hypothetical protein
MTTDNLQKIYYFSLPGDSSIYCNGKLFTGIGVDKYGTIVYCRNGKEHRDNGPAAIYASGAEEYYKNGKLHRIDGPAVVDHRLLVNEYWIDGEELDEEEFNEKIKMLGQK